jgi:Leucine-rich repeat (LRR) protein
MKKILFLIMIFPLLILAQKTYVPDDAFEQALINLDLDDVFDDSVYTSAIDTLQILFIPNKGITDLKGIEDFTALTDLFCYDNQLTELDLSNNTNLFELNCRNNLLTSVDVRNGNNLGFWYFTATFNSDLYCIDVDEVAYANYNWEKDSGCAFSTDCFPASIQNYTSSKKIIKVVDVLGRSVTPTPNMTLFYIYSDGTVEKIINVE